MKTSREKNGFGHGQAPHKLVQFLDDHGPSVTSQPCVWSCCAPKEDQPTKVVKIAVSKGQMKGQRSAGARAEGKKCGSS